jgi:hypothetical protein
MSAAVMEVALLGRVGEAAGSARDVAVLALLPPALRSTGRGLLSGSVLCCVLIMLPYLLLAVGCWAGHRHRLRMPRSC